MQSSFGKLWLTTLAFYLLMGPLRDLLESGDPAGTLHRLGSGRLLVLQFTSWLAFSSYSLGAYLVLRLTYPRRMWVWLVAGLSASALLSIGFRYTLQEIWVLHLLGFRNYIEGYGTIPYLLDNLYYAILYTSLGVVFYFVQYTNHLETLRRKHQQTQLAFLRAQLNPHFLFNILNGIYALVYQGAPQALPALEKLSGLLRYSLYELGERALLAREWAHLHDFLELQSLRLNRALAVKWEVFTEPANEAIPPFLLIPFVENACKHGDLQRPDDPLCIGLRIQDQQLWFWVSNRKLPSQPRQDLSGGLGIANTKQRLDLLYGGGYQLDIQDSDTHFSVSLQLPLSL